MGEKITMGMIGGIIMIAIGLVLLNIKNKKVKHSRPLSVEPE